MVQAGGAGRGAGEGGVPAGDREPRGGERLCQHQGHGRVHHLVLHTARQVTQQDTAYTVRRILERIQKGALTKLF